jgi:hypothetical protein
MLERLHDLGLVAEFQYLYGQTWNVRLSDGSAFETLTEKQLEELFPCLNSR